MPSTYMAHDRGTPHRIVRSGVLSARVDPVCVSGRVLDGGGIVRSVGTLLGFWMTTGWHAKQFEPVFAQRVGVGRALLCDSGSSGDLAALGLGAYGWMLGSVCGLEGSWPRIMNTPGSHMEFN